MFEDRRWLMLTVFILAGVLATPGVGAQPPRPDVILATTTSTSDSGLLEALVPLFQAETGYRLKVIAVGTGEALRMGERGDADVLLTHAPMAEAKLVASGHLIHRRQFMHNDFILVGPAADPAGIRRAESAPAALRQIAREKAPFLSRGDDSGTHKKERALWKEAGLAPAGRWYLEAGQGMGATLIIAHNKRAYTLTDRATYLTFRRERRIDLAILFQGDPRLLNRYSVMQVNPAIHPNVNAAGAEAFSGFLLSGRARQVIREFGRAQYGEALFFLDPVR